MHFISLQIGSWRLEYENKCLFVNEKGVKIRTLLLKSVSLKGPGFQLAAGSVLAIHYIYFLIMQLFGSSNLGWWLFVLSSGELTLRCVAKPWGMLCAPFECSGSLHLKSASLVSLMAHQCTAGVAASFQLVPKHDWGCLGLDKLVRICQPDVTRLSRGK